VVTPRSSALRPARRALVPIRVSGREKTDEAERTWGGTRAQIVEGTCVARLIDAPQKGQIDVGQERSLRERRRPTKRARLAVAMTLLGVAGALAPTAASAAEPEITRLNWNWDAFLDALRDPGVALFARERARLERAEAETSAVADKWFGLSPHVSLVARDWGGAQLLLGNMSVTDQIRLSRSSRMVVSRIRLGGGRFAPFAHVGLGQWRTDTDLMPVLPRDVEAATQFGGGFQLRSRGLTFCVEVDYTLLLRDTYEPQHVSSPHLWGSFLGMRGAF
jgi:hypothetical protein